MLINKMMSANKSAKKLF